MRLIEVTRTPYCLVTLGGAQLATGKGQGTIEQTPSGTQHSFYHLHWYVYPVIYWLELLTDFACLEKGSLDIGYLTELDPLWNDDELAFLLNPGAILFANTIAQAACAADFISTSVGFPIPALFWCGGCQGSLYPFTRIVATHIGGVQVGLLLTQRFMAKLHRQGLLWGYIGTRGLCGKYPMPIIQKQQYQTQMVYPRPTQACHPLGRSEVLWGIGKEYPYQGRRFWLPDVEETFMLPVVILCLFLGSSLVWAPAPTSINPMKPVCSCLTSSSGGCAHRISETSAALARLTQGSIQMAGNSVLSEHSICSMNGRLQHYTDVYGQTHDIEYDDFERTKTLTQGKLTVTFSYDAEGHLAETYVKDQAKT